MSDDLIRKASALIGEEVKLEGLMKKTGRLRRGVAENAKDILGFDYLLRHENTCYEYYAANPPLIGMTQPIPTDCPLGIEVFNEYKIDFQQAVEIFLRGNRGSAFTSIVLFKPMVYPKATEPFWYFKSNIGVQIAVGADSGRVITPK